MANVHPQKIFHGDYAVFSKKVPEIYKHDWVALGGLVVSSHQEITHATFVFVLSKRYIYECLQTGFRQSEEMYAWGGKFSRFAFHCDLFTLSVSPEGYVVPMHTLLDWASPTPKPSLPVRPLKRRYTELEEDTLLLQTHTALAQMEKDCEQPPTGLLTPAPSTRNSKKKKPQNVLPKGWISTGLLTPAPSFGRP
ncbi:hypothetical protein C8J57DRAFT_1324747 [Mycena rebaudengoi]|nr:hypothetical protein C8J57DRAFT_1324747 [Mycena rebaudengoi]